MEEISLTIHGSSLEDIEKRGRFLFMNIPQLFPRFRPFKALKAFLPKTLFARSLLIILAPLILVQSLTTYVFIDRHWSWVTNHSGATIAAQIVTLLDLRENHDPLYIPTKNRFSLEVKTSKHPSISLARWLDSQESSTWEETYFQNILKTTLGRPFKISIKNESLITTIWETDALVHVSLPRKFLFPKTTPIFLMWSLGTPFLFFLIAALFMRNQIRPIRRLANAAYLFGKNQEIKPFKPEGAYEVRKAATAFNHMQERIKRQINQRTEMLAGVSHDLRTPVTRMELQLAMMADSPALQGLKDDLKEMVQTIDDYINFAQGDRQEPSQRLGLQGFFRDLLKKVIQPEIQVQCSLPKTLKFTGRAHALRRCFTNILMNAQTYAQKIWIQGFLKEGHIHLLIQDDGPGIPASQRENVFKPFHRLDPSRNRKTGGSGLGLSIAYDTIISHGGSICVKDSSYGGACIEIILPL